MPQQRPWIPLARRPFGTARSSDVSQQEALPFTPFSKRRPLQQQRARPKFRLGNVLLTALGLTLIAFVFWVEMGH
jgi:hypothetical protein